MSTLSPPNPSNRHPDRAPPPSLFLGPPSRNTSAISLSPTGPPNPPNQQPHDPLLRTRANPPSALDSKPSFIRSRSRPPAINPSQSTQPTQPLKSATPSINQEADRTDALWAEMQATLAEVELSAFSSTHVFGAKHSEALEELRGAQVLLARAWGASEEGEGVGGDVGDGDGDGEKEGKDGEDEEQVDIRVARKRREANERFFKKVQVGVEDVVGKLENVAAAMGRVERESREIWESGSDSLDSGSVTS